MRTGLENKHQRVCRGHMSLQNDLPFSMSSESDKEVLLLSFYYDSREKPIQNKDSSDLEDMSICNLIDSIVNKAGKSICSQQAHSQTKIKVEDNVLTETTLNSPLHQGVKQEDVVLMADMIDDLSNSRYLESSDQCYTEGTYSRKPRPRSKGIPSGGNGKRGPYKKYSQGQKQTFVQEAQKYGVNFVVKQKDIARKTLCRWMSDGVVRRYGGGRQVGDLQMEVRLMKILKSHFKQKGKLLQKARIQQLAKHLSSNFLFTASHGWFQKFYLRHKEDLDGMMAGN